MPTYSMPVVFLIDADSIQEAEQALEDWSDELELDSMPIGCENVIHNPDCEVNEENKILYLPLDSDAEDDDTTIDPDDNDDEDIDE